MDTAQERRLIEILNKHNPWWGSGIVEDVPEFKRRDFYPIFNKFKETRDIIAIVGARQVGKTTILRQCIKDLLKITEAKNILYISMDDIELIDFSKYPLKDVLEVYQSAILKASVSEKTCYILIDEVQKASNWSMLLKNWFDLYPKLNVMISGSSSLNIFKDSEESLVGRIRFQIILPMKFIDFVKLKHHISGNDDKGQVIDKIGLDLRRYLKSAIEEGDVNIFMKGLLGTYSDLSKSKYELMSMVEDFFVVGGYPEIIQIEKLSDAAEKLKTNIDLIVSNDIQRVFKIRDVVTIQKIVRILAELTSNKINIETISSRIRKPRSTVERYISHLEEAFLISKSEFYTGSLMTRVSKQDKIYLNDVGLRNAILDKFSKKAIEEDIGKIAETVAYNHCLRLKYNLNPGSFSKLNYWYYPPKGLEVDIVLAYQNKPIPIEVKYRETPHELKGIKKFLEEKNPPFGIVITKDYMELKDNLLYLPLWIFLILV